MSGHERSCLAAKSLIRNAWHVFYRLTPRREGIRSIDSTGRISIFASTVS